MQARAYIPEPPFEEALDAVSAALEEAVELFATLFNRYLLSFDPQTFAITYAVSLCSQAGLDGEAVLECLLARGDIAHICQRAEAVKRAESSSGTIPGI